MIRLAPHVLELHKLLTDMMPTLPGIPGVRLMMMVLILRSGTVASQSHHDAGRQGAWRWKDRTGRRFMLQCDFCSARKVRWGKAALPG
jgi:hypothetical protein